MKITPIEFLAYLEQRAKYAPAAAASASDTVHSRARLMDGIAAAILIEGFSHGNFEKIERRIDLAIEALNRKSAQRTAYKIRKGGGRG